MPTGARRGFTLVELLCCVIVVALLAGLALPGYRQALWRAHRVDARLALLRVQAQQERHYFLHQRYAAVLEAAPDDGGLGLPAASEAGHYVVTLAASADGQAWRATARPAPASTQQGDVECREFSVDETGRREAAGDGADAGRCWG